ncbi:linear amide C-N hydrolase [Hyunsoonleella pacifica]|uniref:Linear amide C-N hydrolase n=1 Tax=Hyunsoonleella pacifica TaxID=1080224 RepID=A0A4Q9FJC8_9FLAO|nr:linear amide C-N hydrolase [Hyunsoonleella pacifica]TBN13787.1 linear amide C-N hydrolase [Hyunsoonleella pacifica]GGD25646.1 choloylglycine hydrolase [Hyunsoonleella pacifica]
MCTSFLAFKSNQFAITGRSLDYDQDNSYKTVSTPKGTVFHSVLNNGVSWTSSYDMVTVDSVVSGSSYPIPFEGMNSVGISISGNLANAQYPSGKSGSTISSDDFVNYMLAQVSSLQLVPSLLQNLNIKSNWQYHYILFDSSGNSMVVEFANGDVICTANKTFVLTNNPNLNFQLENQNNYANCKNWFPGATLPDTGDQFHGQGMYGIPGDWMSTSRFTRVTTMLKYSANLPTSVSEAVYLSKRIIDSASLIKGIDCGSSATGKPIYTQIQIVKDLVNGVVYTREYGQDTWTVTQV